MRLTPVSFVQGIDPLTPGSLTRMRAAARCAYIHALYAALDAETRHRSPSC
jgi:hypothetical protein